MDYFEKWPNGQKHLWSWWRVFSNKKGPCSLWHRTGNGRFFPLSLSRAHSAYPALLAPARCGGCLVVSSYCFPPAPPPHPAPVLSSAVLSHGALIKAKDRICTVNWCSEQRRSFHSLCLWGSFVPSWNNSRPPFLPSHCSYSAAWVTPTWGRC